MTDVAEKIFAAGDKDWKSCLECKVAAPRLSALVGKYAALKTHLEDVFDKRKVTFVFSKEDDAHFTAADNTITLPHTGNAKDELDLVDAIIFESYNAIRKDQFTASKALSDDSFDLVGSGTLSAEIEAGTMADFHKLAAAMDEKDRTGNMAKCILRAKDAKGSVSAHFLASPHMGDPEKLKQLDPSDERRLPTGVMYVYQAICNAGALKMRAAILKKCGVAFEVVDAKGFQGRATKEVVIKSTVEPQKAAATELDTLVKKNWPVTTSKRPCALLKIIDVVQTKPAFATFKGAVTEAAFGFTSDMKNMGVLNCGGFELKS